MNRIKDIILNHRALSIVLLLGFLASLAYSFYFRVNVTVDARAYDSIAWSLVQGAGYTETTGTVDQAIGRLGPGYEFFLAGIYFIFGHIIWIVWIIQSLLHVCSAFFVYLMVRRFLKSVEWPAILGAGAYMFFIDVLEFPAMLLTETLYLFLVLAGLHFVLNYIEKPNARNVSWAAAILALALLVRPPIAIAMMVFFGFLLFRKYYRHAMYFLIIVVLLLTPWTVRNYIHYNKFIVTSSIIGYDVWVGNNPDSKYIGELTATDEIDDYSAKYGTFAANERGTREVLNLALQHPWEFIKLQLTKTSIYFSAARPAAFWFHLQGLSQIITIILSSLFAYIIFIFGLAGFWRMAWRSDYLSRLFVLLTLAAPVGIIWVVAETRYRYQIYPMLIVSGVLFLYQFLKDKKPKSDWKILTVSLFLITANTSFDIIHNSARVIERFHRLFL